MVMEEELYVNCQLSVWKQDISAGADLWPIAMLSAVIQNPNVEYLLL